MEFNRKIISYLQDWKNKSGRKPLILRGARQTGKTSAVLLFGKKYFSNVVYINLEKTEHRRLFTEDISLGEFEKIINTAFGVSLDTTGTLLFIDEIQEMPDIFNLLRFFYEERPGLPVIAAGSLFEVRLKEKHLNIPVGRVEFAYLHPLDFFEYLEAAGELKTLDFLNSFDFKGKIPIGLHNKFISLFHEYVMIGGMPEAVKTYIESKDLTKVNTVYSNLFTSFKDDVYKYSSTSHVKYLTYVLEQAPIFAGTAVTYEKFGNSNFKSREISGAFDLLEKAMLLYQVRATGSTELPLIRNRRKPPKLIFLDTGFINFLSGIQSSYLGLKDLNGFYRGRIAEQITAQHLFSSMIIPEDICYWYGGGNSEAELDFCLSGRGGITGFEVKSGTYGKLRSAHIFQKRVKSGRLFRIYSGEFRTDREIISLPFYLLPRWRKINNG